ncbi:MAG: crossover junction endodeoxyribonuclease RuvC [Gammaproteobacteria bacterium]
MQIILGIDPGSRITGYGVIRSDGSRHQYIASGVIRTSAELLPQRLGEIFKAVSALIDQHLPGEIAIEEVFMARNPNSALKLGQARGAALAAIAHKGIQAIGQYSPRRIKQAIVGYGAAEKHQIQHMIKCLLNLTGTLSKDAADALAVAICHAQHRGWV